MSTRVRGIVVAAAIAVLWLAGSSAGAAGASTGDAAPYAFASRGSHVHSETAGVGSILYEQIHHPDDVFVLSTRFTDPASKPADSQGADDFTVPSGHSWTVKEVDAIGLYYGPGPASSETVTIYENDGGTPGALVARAKRHGVGSGTLVIRMGRKAPTLQAGSYFLSVQATMQDVSAWWGWMTSTRRVGDLAVWRNPGDGAGGTGCTTWQTMRACINTDPDDPYKAGPDFDFQLRGTDQAG